MATQSANTSPKTKRLGIFPHSFRKFVIIFIIILFFIGGIVWVSQVWGTTSTVLGVIFTVAGVIASILTLWPSNGPEEAIAPVSPSLFQPTPQPPFQVNINIGQSGTIQSIPPSVSNRVHNNEPEGHNSASNADETNVPGVDSSMSPPTVPSLPHVLPSTSFDTTHSMSVIMLTGQESFDLTNALLKVYPDQEDFEVMLKAKLNKKLNTLVYGSHNYSNLLFKLIELTEAEGWTRDLVIAAHEWRPLNTALQSWHQRYSPEKASPEGVKTQQVMMNSQSSSYDSKPPKQSAGGYSQQTVVESKKMFQESPGEVSPLESHNADLSANSTEETLALNYIEAAQNHVQMAFAPSTTGTSTIPSQYKEAKLSLEEANKAITNLRKLLEDKSPLPESISSNRMRIISQINIVTEQIEIHLIPCLDRYTWGNNKPLVDALNEIRTLVSG